MAISERLMVIEMEDTSKNKVTSITVYGPNEDAKIEEKETFWEALAEQTERDTSIVEWEVKITPTRQSQANEKNHEKVMEQECWIIENYKT